MPDDDCAAIVLAAGSSSRLGTPKQLVEINGEALLSRTVRLAGEAGCFPVIVVLGYRPKAMRAVLVNTPVIYSLNEDWAAGMGSSLRSGIRTLESHQPAPTNAMVLVCDQTALAVEILSELRRVHAAGEKPITASRYAGRAGVPAIYSKEFFPDLQQSEGDKGARSLLARHAGQISLVDFPSGVIDLDTPEQLRGLAQRGPG